MQEEISNIRRPQLVYGLNAEGKLVHVRDVANGLACNCICPACKAPLVARNNGINILPHFAHASGTSCASAHESELHLLAKEVIAEEKALMLPAFGNLYNGSVQRFDIVEVEKRTDYSMLQPDLVGVIKSATGSSGKRLWIEIKVTHAVDAEKRDTIRKLGVACIEVDMSPLLDKESSREDVLNYLLTDRIHRRWVNNPLLESIQRQNEENKRAYAEEKALHSNTIHYSEAEVRQRVNDFRQQNAEEGRAVKYKKCATCPNHTSRQAILDEIKLQKFPSVYRDFFRKTNLHLWTENTLMHPIDKSDFNSVYTPEQQFLFSLQSPDRYGNMLTQRQIDQNWRLVKFFGITLPEILRLQGMKCKHNVRVLPSNKNDLRIICDYNKTTLI